MLSFFGSSIYGFPRSTIFPVQPRNAKIFQQESRTSLPNHHMTAHRYPGRKADSNLPVMASSKSGSQEK